MSILGKSKGRPVTKVQFDAIVKRFLIFLKKELRLTVDISFVFIDDANFSKQNSTFGTMNSDGIIYISIINRHPMDILRTLAHEYCHYKQFIKGGVIKSQPGSRSENEANAKAGEILRKYGQLHPELFELTAIK